MKAANPYEADNVSSSPTLAVESMTFRYAVFSFLAAGGCAADLYTKQVMFRWRGLPGESGRWWMIENYFGIETAVNTGALFGMGKGYTSLFAVLSIGAFLGILYVIFLRRGFVGKWLTVALGFVTGGILGNLYDRLGIWHTAGLPEMYRNGVRDWILFQCPPIPLRILNPWPNFNIADVVLVTGAIMLALHSFRPEIETPNTGKSEATS